MALMADIPSSEVDPLDALQTRNLAAYENSSFDPGRGFLLRFAWYYFSLIVMESGWFPFSRLKVAALRLFGASIGNGVVIHPNVRIKFPWKLKIGDHCWIGREVWIDNLENVTLESDVCLSQQAYLCTGSHNHRSPVFELRTDEIRIQHGAWICCRATVLAGVTIPRLLVVPAGQVVSRSPEPAMRQVPHKPR